MPSSPALRNNYVPLPQGAITQTMHVTQKRDHLKSKDVLLWALERLCIPSEVESFGLPDLLDNIDRIMSRSKDNRDRISSMVASLLSNLALLGELSRQIQSETTPSGI